MRTVFLSVLILLVTLGMTGCADLFRPRQSHYASSTVKYLYPDRYVAETPTIPTLSLPLNVGVAFVPETESSAGHAKLSEKDRLDLMERVVAEFKGLEFVKDIELIPSAYLTRGGSFTNLDQIKTMYGIDVMVLLSYDQVQHTDEGMLSLAYWTIVGAYIFKGEKNDTSTMIDATVYDIASRKMLFRAPGTSLVSHSATPINLSEQLREDSLQGFRDAADGLVVNLSNELDRFKNKVKEKPHEYVVRHKSGYTGGSAFGDIFGVLMLAFAGLVLWKERIRQ